MQELSQLGILSVFLAGLISFLSPCVLPLVPGYVSYVAGQSLEELERPGLSRRRLRALLFSLLFVLGFSVVFIGFGASATVLGRLLISYRYEFNIVAGVVVILFGLLMLGLPLPFFGRDLRWHRDFAGGNPWSALLIGVAFGFGWTPCIGPILGAILTVSATTADVGGGVALLAIYSAGLGVPFIVAALFTGTFVTYSRRLRRIGPLLQRVAGLVLIALGVAMITGYLTRFSFWLLDAAPWLGTLG